MAGYISLIGAMRNMNGSKLGQKYWIFKFYVYIQVTSVHILYKSVDNRDLK